MRSHARRVRLSLRTRSTRTPGGVTSSAERSSGACRQPASRSARSGTCSVCRTSGCTSSPRGA